jgi:5-methyltetrahydrofolate--homocysteine methyltransferase
MDERCTTFEELLATGDILVADGAMGTTLFSLGLEGGGCPGVAQPVEQPEPGRRRFTRNFIDAGADIILTNTFGGNERRLQPPRTRRSRWPS